MIKHNQEGATSLVLPLTLSVLAFVGALGFGLWAYAGKQDYKNNTDEKIAVAVAEARTAEAESKSKQFAELAKQPLKTYTGPEQYGSVVLQYPKTWSAYVSAGSAGSSAPLDGYFNPDVVPSVADTNNTFALRIEVLDRAYSEVLKSFSSKKDISITPFALAKVPKVVGVKIQGQLENDKKGSMVILPVRDKTLQVYTESDNYQNDFNNIILPNLSFSP